MAGSRDGISALQMDIKIEGITKEIMQVALNQLKVRVCTSRRDGTGYQRATR